MEDKNDCFVLEVEDRINKIELLLKERMDLESDAYNNGMLRAYQYAIAYYNECKKSRWVSGKILLKYYDFTDYAMRQIKKTSACKRESHNTYLYNIDNLAITGRKIIIPKIPEHLIRYASDA